MVNSGRTMTIVGLGAGGGTGDFVAVDVTWEQFAFRRELRESTRILVDRYFSLFRRGIFAKLHASSGTLLVLLRCPFRLT